MTTTSAEIPAEPVSTKKKKNNVADGEFWRRNIKDDVLLLIKNALRKGHIPVQKMYEVMKSNKYQECRNMGYNDELTQLYIVGLGLGFKVFYNDLELWRNNQHNNISSYIDEYEQIIAETMESRKFIMEWKASPYCYDLRRYIDSVVDGRQHDNKESEIL